MIKEGKPESVISKILEGKKDKIVKEVSLLSQDFIKNPDIKVNDYLQEIRQATGENIVITRFVIYKLND
jgi:elongation factor Ts